MYTTSISRFGRTDSIQQSPYLCELIFFILYVLQISSWQLIFSHSRVALSPFKTHMSFLILFLFNCTTCTHTTHIAALLHVPYTIHYQCTIHYQLFNPIPDKPLLCRYLIFPQCHFRSLSLYLPTQQQPNSFTCFEYFQQLVELVVAIAS